MFRTVFPSVIRSLRLYLQHQVCVMQVLWLLASGNGMEPSSLLYNGYQVFPGGKEWPGRDADPSTPSSTVGYEGVELYLYSP